MASLVGCSSPQGAGQGASPSTADLFAEASGLTGSALASGREIAKDVCSTLAQGAATGKIVNTPLYELAQRYDVDWMALGQGGAPQFEKLVHSATTAYCPDLSSYLQAFFSSTSR
jgi:hypothetical protein